MLPNEELIKTRIQLKHVLEIEKSFYCQSRYGEAFYLRKHICLLRKCEYHTNAKHKIRSLFYKLRLKKLQCRFCLHIPINCCKKGLKIMHLGPVLINSNAIVGENCIFHINTAVVARGTAEGAPIVGDNVVFGIGSVALGNIIIPSGVAIGANAVVNKTIEENNITVAGVPAKKISNNGRFEWNKKVKK